MKWKVILSTISVVTLLLGSMSSNLITNNNIDSSDNNKISLTDKKKNTDKEEKEKIKETTVKENETNKVDDEKENISNNSISNEENNFSNANNYQQKNSNNSSNDYQPNNSNNTTTIPKTLTEWEKLGISEYDYYNTPTPNEGEIAKGITDCDSKAKEINDEYGFNVHSGDVKSYSDKYLGCWITIHFNDSSWMFYNEFKARADRGEFN